MYYKDIKDLLEKLNSENIEKLKPALTRKVNELILNISDESMSDEELEKLSQTVLHREEFRAEFRKEVPLIEGLVIEEFINVFEQFVREVGKNEYITDIIEIINSAIRGIGDFARGYKLMRKYCSLNEGVNNSNYLYELKEEFYKVLRSYSTKGIYQEHFVICGLINYIKFDLEGQSQEHGRKVISFLTNYKTKELRSIEEFEGDKDFDGIKFKIKREYGIELQRRVYLWNKLTQNLQDHYYLEHMYEEEENRLENLEKE